MMMSCPTSLISSASTSPMSVCRTSLSWSHTLMSTGWRVSHSGSGTSCSIHMSSPNLAPAPNGKDLSDRRRQQTKEKVSDMQSMPGSIPGDLPKKEHKKRQHRLKEKQPIILLASFKVVLFSAKEAQDTSSSNGSGSCSLQPSWITPTPYPPSHVVDEDYEEGVADALIVLLQSHSAPVHSPTLSNGSRHAVTSPQSVISHHRSVSMSGSHPSPPGVDEVNNKHTRVDPIKCGHLLLGGTHLFPPCGLHRSQYRCNLHLIFWSRITMLTLDICLPFQCHCLLTCVRSEPVTVLTPVCQHLSCSLPLQHCLISTSPLLTESWVTKWRLIDACSSPRQGKSCPT
jgi:hypothetical protein